jgi:hypothetical protein
MPTPWNQEEHWLDLTLMANGKPCYDSPMQHYYRRYTACCWRALASPAISVVFVWKQGLEKDRPYTEETNGHRVAPLERLGRNLKAGPPPPPTHPPPPSPPSAHVVGQSPPAAGGGGILQRRVRLLLCGDSAVGAAEDSAVAQRAGGSMAGGRRGDGRLAGRATRWCWAMRLGAWPRAPAAAGRARSGPVLGRQGGGAGELLEAALGARRRRQAGAAAPGTRW